MTLANSEAAEMHRYISLRRICGGMAQAEFNNQIIGAANVAACSMAAGETRLEMMTKIAARVPGLTADDVATAVAAAEHFLATEKEQTDD